MSQKPPRPPPRTYGTIPNTTATTTTTAQPSPPTTTTTSLTFISRATAATQALIHTRRPWRELFTPVAAFSRPYSYPEAITRIRHNLNHFCVNYAMIALSILFLSLLWHPISMIVFIALFIAWYFLYFDREAPVVAFHQTLDDRVILGALGLVTIIALVFTHVGTNVLVALVVAVVVVGLHAAFRVTEDMFLDEETAAEGGLVSVVGNQQFRPTAGYTRI
ncbi:hypothetical protein Tsubulata_001356 [Turnera subulata]|uniref:PRA1 family protein n=1 Tax=Turnera subulata TaxID=218843 RepID=A0A9Q0FLH1_9ROSI|nr:hypothetical protein Tsubulata_001356 [Turnera subulata]